MMRFSRRFAPQNDTSRDITPSRTSVLCTRLCEGCPTVNDADTLIKYKNTKLCGKDEARLVVSRRSLVP